MTAPFAAVERRAFVRPVMLKLVVEAFVRFVWPLKVLVLVKVLDE